MTIRLLAHHVLVKLDDPIEADESLRRARDLGIIVELDKREKQAVEYGTVVQVGPTAYRDFGFESPPICNGDRVSLVKYSGKKITDIGGQEYFLFNDSDILATIE